MDFFARVCVPCRVDLSFGRAVEWARGRTRPANISVHDLSSFSSRCGFLVGRRQEVGSGRLTNPRHLISTRTRTLCGNLEF